MPPDVFTLEELSEIVHDSEHAEDDMLAADPNLEMSVAVCQE